MNRLVRVLGALVVVLWAGPAVAGGYDTPMLYSARHMGMGGTAIGWVADPSALFHNPAGLAHVRGLSLMADFSPLIGTVSGSPFDDPANPTNPTDRPHEATSLQSETTFAPFFLAGVAWGVTDWLTIGAAVYPVASAGATYEYELNGQQYTDHTRLVFIEVSPGLAVQLPHGIRLGLGYRINSTSLDRTRDVEGDPESDNRLDLSLTGTNFFSLRLGAQWQPIPELELGIVYRQRTITDVSGDSGRALGVEFTDVRSEFTLPTRFGVGARGNFGPFHAALDLEYALNSENVKAGLSARPRSGIPPRLEVFNQFRWSNALTMRVGAEYRFMDDHIATRVGYVFDGKTATEQYPTAFGTPPGPTHVVTVGAGYDAGPWEVNLAYAYRFGSADVSDDDIGTQSCLLCGAPGEYAIGLHGVYVDFSIEIGGQPAPPPDDPNGDLVAPEPSTSAPPHEPAPVAAPPVTAPAPMPAEQPGATTPPESTTPIP